jgi:hypothetical protein
MLHMHNSPHPGEVLLDLYLDEANITITALAKHVAPLSFSTNQLQKAVLAKALETNTSLHRIGLRNNAIGNAGAPLEGYSGIRSKRKLSMIFS